MKTRNIPTFDRRLGPDKAARQGMSEGHLGDRASIHDLFTRYCCALDNGEVEAVIDCFTIDAILKSPVIDISGRDEIRTFATRFATLLTAGTQFRHMVSNIAVTITGNRAAANAYLLVLITKDGNHRSLPPGRYACELNQRRQRPMALFAPYRLS
jgi:ketosteroid isomerase-like protein